MIPSANVCRLMAPSLLLSVIGLGAVFAEIVFIAKCGGKRLHGWIDRHGLPRHGGQLFDNYGGVDGIRYGFAPEKRSMPGDQRSRTTERVAALEQPDDRCARVGLIVGIDLIGAEGLGDGYRPAKVIGVSGPEAGNFAAGLSPGGSVPGMRVRYASDGGEGAVQSRVCRQVRRRAQRTFDNAAVEIGYHHIAGAHLVIRNAAGLDDDEPFFERHGAGVTKGINDQTTPDELEVGFVNLSPQRLQQSNLRVLQQRCGAAPARHARDGHSRNPAGRRQSTTAYIKERATRIRLPRRAPAEP